MLCPPALGINNFSALAVETTYVYLHADLKLKEQAMARTTPLEMPPARYRPDDEVLAFLNGL